MGIIFRNSSFLRQLLVVQQRVGGARIVYKNREYANVLSLFAA